MSGERIVEWLFIPWETFMSSSYFDLASHKRKRKHVSPSYLRREGKQSLEDGQLPSAPVGMQAGGCFSRAWAEMVPKAPGV